MPPEATRGRPSRWLVQVTSGASMIVGYVEGWQASCGCGFAGLLRSSVQQARRDLREHDHRPETSAPKWATWPAST